ncbi:MAG: N-acetylglucosamine-6-phosphate deacetylase [Clostridia bacterium]|nr:N-acetylglucosamine-6-phosphate deacetylase [Clostridia bacterium]
MIRRIRNARLAGPEGGLLVDVEIEGGRIAAVRPARPGAAGGRAGGSAGGAPGREEELDLEGLLLAPGFLDPHIHGAVGADFGSGQEEQIHRILAYLPRWGVTGCLATLRTASPERLRSAVEALGAYVQRPGEAALLGIHLEGPFLSPEAAGAQDRAELRLPDALEFRRLLEASNGRLRMITLAPELPGARELIRMAAAAGVQVAMGHSAATWEEALAGLEAGAIHVTHLFNGMRPWHHRDPGLAGLALADPRLTVHLIADGQHLHPGAVRAAWNATRAAAGRGPRLALMSDAMEATGLGDGLYVRANGQRITVRDGVARLEGGTLAGGTATLGHAVERLVAWGLPLDEAVEAAGAVIAPHLGCGRSRGRVAPGYLADLVALDERGRIRRVLLGGVLVHRHGDAAAERGGGEP